MEFATHWDAVFNPQLGDRYFDRADEIRFDPTAIEFSPANAWWLAETSRWIYNANGKARGHRVLSQKHLEGAGLHEIIHLSIGGTHASLVQSAASHHAGPFTVLVFRGSSGPANWIDNLLAFPTRARVHFGYARALLRVWRDLEPAVARLSAPLFITGHSMGGALAELAARRLPCAGVYTFGAPGAVDPLSTEPQPTGTVYRVINYRDLAARAARTSRFLQAGEILYLTHSCELWHGPTKQSIARDRALGTRPLTRQLNRGRLFVIPEAISDHAPINYVAHLERIALGR